MQRMRIELRQARDRKMLSALALATEADTTEARIYAYERGRCTPSVDEARRIVAALGVKLENVFPELVVR